MAGFRKGCFAEHVNSMEVTAMKSLPNNIFKIVTLLLIGATAILMQTACGGGGGSSSSSAATPTASVVIMPAKVSVVTAN